MATSLQIVNVLLVTIGSGLTVIVTLNAAPGQSCALTGVTVYVALTVANALLLCVKASFAKAVEAKPFATAGDPAVSILFGLKAVTLYVAAGAVEVEEPKLTPTGTSEHDVKT